MAQTFNNLAEVQAYLQANPNFKGTVTQGGNPTRVAPKRGLLGNIIGTFTDPTVGLLKKGFEGVNAASTGNLKEFITGDPAYQTQFLNNQEYSDFRANPFLDTAKDVAGVASFAIPGGMFGKGIGAALRGGAAGGLLGGISASDADSISEFDLGQLTQDALLGGAFGGAADLAGRGISAGIQGAKKGGSLSQFFQGASQKLDDVADNRSLNAFTRNIGAKQPFTKGGAPLEKEAFNLAKRFGREINNADDLIQFSDDIFTEYGGIVRQQADKAAEAGRFIDLNETLIEPLTKELNTPGLTDSARQPLQKVIQEIQSIAPDGVVDPLTAYKAKQVLGEFGKFNPFVDAASASTADKYQKAYGLLNDKIKKTLEDVGFEQYSEVNKLLETAIKQKKWGEIATGKLRPVGTFNDMMQDVGGFFGDMGGNPIFALPGMALGKVMQSPITEKGLGGVTRGLADFFGMLSNEVPEQIDNVAQAADNSMLGLFRNADEVTGPQFGFIDEVTGPQFGFIDEAISTPAIQQTQTVTGKANIKKALGSRPELSELLEGINAYEEILNDLNTGSLGNKVGQVRKALNAGNDAVNVAGVDVLAQELQERLPGFVQIDDVSNPSDVVEGFLSAKDNLQSQLNKAYSDAEGILSGKVNIEDLSKIKTDGILDVDNTKNMSTKTKNTELLKEATNYNTPEEFIAKVKGSATQYTGYTPELRLNVTPGSKRLTELGIEPEQTVTVYRGLDGFEGSILDKKINDGDFVTTDYDSALSYADRPENVIEMEVKAKDLFAEEPDDFIEDPFYIGGEYVYSTKQGVDVNLSDEELTNIWNEANKKVPDTKNVPLDNINKEPIPDTQVFSQQPENIFTQPVSQQNTQVNIPQQQTKQSMQAPQALKSLFGLANNAAQGAGDLISKLDPNTLPKVAGAVSGQYNKQPRDTVDLRTFLQGLETVQQTPQQETVGQTGLGPQEQALYQQLVTPTKSGGLGFTPDEAEQYLSTMYGANFSSTSPIEGKKTESQRKYLAAGKLAEEALGLLQSGDAKTGKVASVGDSIGSFLGSQSPSQTDYRSKLASARGAAISALAGANVPESEYARIADMIPEMMDEQKVAEQKIRSFVQAMNVYANA